MNTQEIPDALEAYIHSKLNTHETSHPNIIEIWREYIEIKKNSYMKALVDCDIMIRNITEHRDISPKTIMLLYMLFQNDN
jgi:hypothetical protein